MLGVRLRCLGQQNGAQQLPFFNRMFFWDQDYDGEKATSKGCRTS